MRSPGGLSRRPEVDVPTPDSPAPDINPATRHREHQPHKHEPHEHEPHEHQHDEHQHDDDGPHEPRPGTPDDDVLGPATWATLPAKIARDDVAGLCEQLRTLLGDDGTPTVVYDLSALAVPGVVVVDALARLQLTARRLGRRIVVHGADGALRELLDLIGLRDLLLPSREELLVEGRRQAEQREQPLGVEERVDSDDLTA